MANEVNIIVKAKDEASGTIEGVSQKAKGLSGVMGKAVTAGAFAGGAAIAGLGIAAVKMAADFEKGFGEVQTLLPQVSEQGIAKLKSEVIDFSKQMGVATDEALPALYQAISAGVPPDNVIDFMRVATKASVGGVTDLETAVDGITSAVNAYGAESLSAQQASDLMFTTVKLGKTDFEQLSGALFNVLPTASSLGVTMQEVSASLATMTLQGVPTRVATTQLRAALVEASKGGTKLDQAIQDLTGKSMAQLVGEGRTATGVFEELRGSMPEQDFKDLFGSIEALNGVLLTTGPNAESFNSALEAMGESGGATDAAFETMSNTFSFQLNKAINTLKVTLMELGLKVLPTLTAGLKTASEFVNAFLEVLFSDDPDVTSSGAFGAGERFAVFIRQELVPVLKDVGRILREEFGKAFEQLKQTIDGAAPIVRSIFEFLKDNPPVLYALIAALAALAIAFGGPVTAIIGVIAIGTVLLAHWDDIRNAVTALVDKIKTDFPVIAEIAEFVFSQVKARVEFWVNEVKAVIQIVMALIRGDWDAAWQGIKDALDGFWQLIKSDVESWLALITGIIKLALPDDLLAKPFDMAREAIRWLIRKVDDLVDALSKIKVPDLGILGDAAGFIGSGGGLFRQHGGPVVAGQRYTVGEAGPETFIPGVSGMIVPNGGGGVNAGQLAAIIGSELDKRIDRIVGAITINIDGREVGRAAMRYGGLDASLYRRSG